MNLVFIGINSKFYWNTSYFDKEYEGVCYCTKSCKGKGCGIFMVIVSV